MTTTPVTSIRTAIYDALIAAGAPEDKARAAAADHLPAAMITTKADLEKIQSDLEKLRGELKAGLAELKAELTWRLILAVGIAVSIVALLQSF